MDKKKNKMIQRNENKNRFNLNKVLVCGKQKIKREPSETYTTSKPTVKINV